MATLTLTKLFVNLLSDGTAISAQSTSRSRTDDIDGEVRTYAGGRRRSVVSEGAATTFTFTMRLLTLTQVETLITWIGKTVQVRDHRGQRFFGVFYQVTPVELVHEPTLWDAQIEVRTVTVTEGV